MTSTTVVAVHDTGSEGRVFEPVADHLPGNVAMRTITLPGFGDRPPIPGLTTAGDFAHVVAAHVWELTAPVVLLGHGTGASFVLEALSRRPHLAAGAILHAPVGPRSGRGPLRSRRRRTCPWLDHEVLDERWFADLRPLAVPTALLWGGRDRRNRSAELASLAHLLPGTHVQRVEHWGRTPMLDDPDGYASIIAGLAAQLVARSAQPLTNAA